MKPVQLHEILTICLDTFLFLSQAQFMVSRFNQNEIGKHKACSQRCISAVKNLFFGYLLCRNLKQSFTGRAQMQSFVTALPLGKTDMDATLETQLYVLLILSLRTYW